MNKIFLPQSRILKPYKQGDLDPLCGLYATINAIRLAIYEEKKLTKRHARELMEAGFNYFGGRKGKLLSVCTHGMGKSRRLKLIQHLFEYVLEEWGVQLELISFVQIEEESLKKGFYTFLETVLTSGNPVTVDLSGEHEHFTVISGLTSTYIELFDSDGLKRLARRSVRIGFGKTSIRHSLNPIGIIGMRSAPPSLRLSTLF